MEDALEERLELKQCERVYSGHLISSECPIADRCSKDVDESECVLCCDRIYSTLKDEGYFVIRSGRANIVAIPSRMESKIGEDVLGLKVIVFSDPDSGISNRDEIFIAGFRFGIDDILLNGYPVYTVHGDYGSDVRYCVGRLMVRIMAESFRIGEERAKELAEQLKRIAEVLGEKVDERYLFGNTYMGHPPKRILIISGRDACRGVIAKVVLRKILDEAGLYNVSIDSAAYDKPGIVKEARDVVKEKYGDLLKDHVPKSIEDVKTRYGYWKIVDHDLIIVMEDGHKHGLPEGRTFTIKELAGEKGSIREPSSVAECKDVAEEIERCLRAGIDRIREILYG
ncbi:Protein-tyrosine-phosphatase [Archaeoglobus fulgidus DSM 8774]|uniref:Protein-tyrosine-phosphatase n=1 Tax=Archaeoglobus fulgidus DSM 8774 TaxID=1344584 RepID=A0A075WEN2_ARCFL|nr:hypothetical protein [Archaeoglobus fulgidus]AIG98456.1 Protein-tyrosine-phosphatase [Archaeoglobus fulgidus DSM 8774]